MSKKEKKQDSSPVWGYMFFALVLVGAFFILKDKFDTTNSLSILEYLEYIGNLLLISLLICIGVLATSTIVVKTYYHYRTKKDLVCREIILNNKNQAKPKQVNEFILDLHKRHRVWYQRLARGREWFGLLTRVNDKNEISMYILFPQDKTNGVTRAILSHFPTCKLKDIKVEDLELPRSTCSGGNFRLNMSGKQAGLPLKAYEESNLGSIYEGMGSNTWMMVRFSPNASNGPLRRRVEKGLRSLGMTKKDLETIFQLDMDTSTKAQSDLEPHEKARYKSLFQQNTGREKSFQVAVSLFSSNQTKPEALVQDTKASIERIMEFDNYIYMRKIRLFNRLLNPLQPLNMIPRFFHRMVWSHTELGNLVHFPDGRERMYDMPEKETDRPYIPPQEAVPEDELNEGFFVGNLTEGSKRSVRIPYPTWTYMSFGSGATGSGKTTIALNIVYDHLPEWYKNKEAPGITFVDPKGQDALKILAKINSDFHRMEKEGIDTSELKKRVHFFDISSDKYILGLNLLHKNDGDTNDQVANNALDLLKIAYNRESMLLDKFGQLALHALLLDEGNHSILGMEQILRKDETFRNRILPKVKNTIFEKDWNENKKDIKRGQVTMPVLNRMQKIRLNTKMRRIFGQSKMGLHPAKWMDQGHIVIISCANLSEDERAIVLGFITTQYHLQAQKRKKMNKIHLHITDEFHLMQIPVVKKINAIDRYTGHSYFPMTQYVDQIRDDIVDAFDGNVSTYIACTQGSKSADRLHLMSRKTIDSNEIQNLETLTAIISTMNRKGERITFKVKSPPPYLYKENGEPAFFGENIDKERHEREQGEAFAVARQFGEELMRRDCDRAEDVDEWINDYLSVKTIFQEKKEREDQEEQQQEGLNQSSEETPTEETISKDNETKSDESSIPVFIDH